MRILVVLALVLAACGDDDSGGGTPSTVAEVEAAYRAAMCRYFVACGQFPDRATCMSANLLLDPIIDFGPNSVAAVSDGRAVIDTARVSGCLAAVDSLTCDRTDRSWREIGLQCHNLVVGTRHEGEPCYTREECISQQCSGGYNAETCELGACRGDTPPVQPHVRIGGSCSNSGECVEGAFCDLDVTGTCLALRSAGEECTYTEQCAYGLGCAGDIGARTCKALPALDEPCPDGTCRDYGTYCSASGRCERLGLAGASCSGPGETCAPNYPCNESTGTCERGPGLGDPCALSPVRCFDAGLVCDTNSGTCIEPRADGEPCTIDAVCKGYCGYQTGVCTPIVVCR